MAYTIKDATLQNSGVDMPLQPKINFTGSGVAVTDGPGSKTTVTITGATPQLFANALFVDAIYGNNTGAAPDTMMDSTTNPGSHKYRTVTAAKTAATSGDIVIVYPGTYSESDLFKNGVTYYFYPGAIVNNCSFVVPTGQTCKVYGSGSFTGGSYLVYSNDAGALGTFYMEAYSMIATNNTLSIGNGDIEIHTDLLRATGISAIDLNDSGDPGLFNRLTVTANVISSSGFSGGPNPTINMVMSYLGYDGEVNITANRIIGSNNAAAEVMHFDNYIVPNNRTTVRIKANTIESTTASPAMINVEYNNNTRIFIEGEIRMPNNEPIVGIITGAANSGTEFTYTGNISSGTTTVILGGDGEIINLNGTFTITNPPV